ncbi:MAG: Fe-S cluster assembly protein SufD [Verrucomicrobiota bacterium]
MLEETLEMESSTSNPPSKLLETLPAAPAPNLPDWYLESRRVAWDRFQALPLPQRKDESWRFANWKEANLSHYVRAKALPQDHAAALAARLPKLEGAIARFVFVNGHLAVREVGELPEGVTALPLNEALQTAPELVRPLFAEQRQELGSAKYAALHKATSDHGIFLHAADQVELKRPIEVVHWVSGEDAAVLPRTLVSAGKNAELHLIERLFNADATTSGLIMTKADLHAAEGGRVRYAIQQDLNMESRFMQLQNTVVARDADIKSLFMHVGSRWVRSENLSRMTGTGANSEMLSLAVAGETQEMDQRTLQSHEAPHTTSDLLYKNALYDEARSIFAGLIRVDEGAHYTDAYQTCRNLLLSDKAEANSMPGLEINADQVKCSHGSTSGSIPDEDLFYFMSRGIDARAARKLIIFGFSKEVIDRIGDETIVKLLLETVNAKFVRLGV